MERSFVFAVDVTREGVITWLDDAAVKEPIPPATWRWLHMDRSVAGMEDLLVELGFPPLVIPCLSA